MADSAAKTLAPITQERVEAQLDGFNLQYFRDEQGMTVTAFPGMVSFAEFADAGAKITTRWMGTITGDEDTRSIRERANELNSFIPLVRVHPVSRADGSTVVLMEAPLFSTVGVTDSQLRSMLELYFSTTHHLLGELRKALPHISDDAITEENNSTEA